MAALAAPPSSAVAHWTVTSRPDTGVRLTVKATPAPSAALAAAMDSTGGSSSSAILIAAGVTVSVPAEPVRLSASSFSSRSSSVGVRAKSAYALDSPAGMVIVTGATAV